MQVTAAWRKGRVDAVVQSTDKNFMVPVGGAVIAASKQSTSLVDAVNKVWPWEASDGHSSLWLHNGPLPCNAALKCIMCPVVPHVCLLPVARGCSDCSAGVPRKGIHVTAARCTDHAAAVGS